MNKNIQGDFQICISVPLTLFLWKVVIALSVIKLKIKPRTKVWDFFLEDVECNFQELGDIHNV